MNLDDFENHLPKMIVARGREYFFEHRVKSLEEKCPNEYAATVIGNDDYTVELTVNDDGSIVEVACDCPYTGGDHCKHMTAVFFALHERRYQHTSAASRPISKLAQNELSLSSSEQQLRQYLASLESENLIELLLTFAEEYPGIGDRLKARAVAPHEEKEHWLRLMRRSIQEAMDHHGFITFRNCRYAIEGAEQVVERARAALDDGEYELAVELLSAVLEEMANLVEFADDSGGEVGIVVDEVESLMSELADTVPAGKVSEACFTKILSSAQNACFDGWANWRLPLLEVAVGLVTTTQQRMQIERYLQKLMGTSADETSSFSSNYDAESFCSLYHKLITECDGPEKAAEFLYQHLHFPRFRKMAIADVLQEQKYKEAELLALEGESKDCQLPGLVRQWKELRFEIYQQGKNIEQLRHVGTELVLAGDFKFYGKVKNTYDSSEWSRVYPDILDALANRSYYSDATYTSILIEEKEWDKLLSYVTKQPNRIIQYYQHLLPQFSSQVYELFAKVIIKESERSSSRAHYQQVCSHLKLMKEIGDHQKALDLAGELLSKYPRRPAFREELLKAMK